MDNAQKAIMIGVGLFITIIIIAAVMLITGMGQNLLNQGQAQVNGISESLMNDLTSQYDGKTFSGSQVKSAVVQLANRDDASLKVFVVEGSGQSKVETEIKDVAASGDIPAKSATQLANETLKGKETAKYIGSVSSTNGQVTIKFTKK